MELWIRSQDKNVLVICSKLYVGGTYGNEIIEEDMCSLGKYRSRERALEVLDEIQKILKPQLIIKDSGKIIGSFEDTIIRKGATYELKELSTYVYEMPEN